MNTRQFKVSFLAIVGLMLAPVLAGAVDLQYIEDRLKIEDLLVRYSYALDTADAVGYGAVFTEDAYLDIAGTPYHGRKAIQGFIEDINAKLKLTKPAKGVRYLPIRHVLTNVLIEIKGNTATSNSFFTEVMSNGRDAKGHGKSQSILNMGRYEDELVKQNGQWLIKKRMIVSDMYGKLPMMDLSPFPQQAGPTDESP